ncbi:phosphodiester glycosidase family protein [Fortiea contorta]|uniref:phosphodiester glycosidase family protein n=1 Tax=Fortiea contorta TaxID=1892405 RepID=UPI00034B2A52|nr:phosphodiester glycosidase family protein [Fortiea contorta]
MRRRYQISSRRLLIIAGISLLLSPFLLYGYLCLLRPPRTNQQQTLFNGVVYQRRALPTPRPVMMHIVTVDLTTPGIKALVTPGTPTQTHGITTARTTSEFLDEFKLQIAINASYFHPFRENNPWDYYPHSSDISHPWGDAISNGSRYAKPQKNWAVVCISQQNKAQILASGSCPQDTAQGVAGKQILVADRKPMFYQSTDALDIKPYPRVAVAVNREGTKLWLIAVDGKQKFYSEGLTIAEFTNIVAELGVHNAVNMDGGGSTTLAIATSSGAQVLNAPIHTNVPMRERPVANHLGFFATPLHSQK